ncbi:MAG: hypothetical protein KY432_06965, partial [Acidobacteria bacterium]|nr:hypothetical protein [Acidobacteriota bacterium]
GLHALLVLVGEGWRFGRKAAGDTIMLSEIGRNEGFDVDPVTLEEVGGDKVSSTRVRRAVADGDLGLARDLLGRQMDRRRSGCARHSRDRSDGRRSVTTHLVRAPARADLVVLVP